MIVNELKPLLGDNWREKFVHRDLWDPEGYGVASFDLGGDREKVLAINFATEDIMEYFYDDKPDDEWISLDRVLKVKGKPSVLQNPTKYFCNKLYTIKRVPKHSYEDKLTGLFDLIHESDYKFGQYPRKKLYHSLLIPIHILIGILFVPNPNPERYTIVNHRDKSRTNFTKENLEWCDNKWNSQKKNKKDSEPKVLYLCIDSGKVFSRNELISKYCPSAPSTIWESIQKNSTYKGHKWKILNPALEDYLSRHPLQDDWYQHPTMPNVRANGCGVLEIDGKPRIGTKNNRYYVINIGKKLWRTHRILYECFENRLLSDQEVVDHVVPVSCLDCDNSKKNLRAVDSKGNMNNPLTINKLEKKVVMYDLLGNPVRYFKSIKRASEELSIDAQGISSALGDKTFTYKGYFWIEEGNESYLNYKQSFLYTSWDKDRNLVSISLEFSKVQTRVYKGGSGYARNRKYINTGVQAPDGFYYQQGDPQHMIYNPSNHKLIKVREEVRWINRRSRARVKDHIGKKINNEGGA